MKGFSSSSPKRNYITEVAKIGNIEDSVLANGVLKPYQLVAVGARTTGKVVSLKVNPGDKVSKGDLLVKIESTNQENNLKKAKQALAAFKAKLAQEQVQLTLSQEKLARSQKLLSSNAIMKSAYNEAKAQVEMEQATIANLKAGVVQAELDVSTAQIQLSYTQITAPMDGTVLANLVQEGQNINALQTVPEVVLLGNLRKMLVYAQISEADINKVHIGQEVYFNLLGNSKRIYHAKLERLEPAPEGIRDDITFNSSARTGNASAVYYNGIFSIDNSDNSLLTYMNCEVHIVLAKHNNVLLIPSAALQHINDDNTAVVLVKNGKKVESRHITIGLNNKVSVEVVSGLEAGEEVVVSPAECDDDNPAKSSGPVKPPHPMHMRAK